MRQEFQHNAYKSWMSNIFRSHDAYVEVETWNDGQLSSIMQVRVDKGNKGWYGLRPDDDLEVPWSRLMHLVKHQLSWDTSLWAVELTGSPLKRGDILLYNLIEEHGG